MQIWLSKPEETKATAALALFWDQSAGDDQSCPFIQNIHPNYVHKNSIEPSCGKVGES